MNSWAAAGIPVEKLIPLPAADDPALRENPGCKLRRILASAPSLMDIQAFNGPTIRVIEDREQNRVRRQNFDISQPPRIAEFATQQEKDAVLNNAFVAEGAEDYEWVTAIAPHLEHRPYVEGGQRITTPQSLARRVNFLAENAVQIIDRAESLGADLPETYPTSKRRIAHYSIPVLKVAIDFLRLYRKEGYDEVNAIIKWAVHRQSVPAYGNRWQPGGDIFEAMMANYIGEKPGMFNREDVLNLYNKYLKKGK